MKDVMFLKRRHDIQQNDNQHNDTQHKGLIFNINDTQHNNTLPLS